MRRHILTLLLLIALMPGCSSTPVKPEAELLPPLLRATRSDAITALQSATADPDDKLASIASEALAAIEEAEEHRESESEDPQTPPGAGEPDSGETDEVARDEAAPDEAQKREEQLASLLGELEGASAAHSILGLTRQIIRLDATRCEVAVRLVDIYPTLKDEDDARSTRRALLKICPERPLLDFAPKAEKLIRSLAETHQEADKNDSSAALLLGRIGAVALEQLLDASLPKGQASYTDLPRIRSGARGAGAMGAEAIPRLIELVESDLRWERDFGARALGWIGADAAEAVDPLKKMLRGAATGNDSYPKSLGPDDRSDAAWALGRIGEAASSAAPALRRALRKGSFALQQEAALALPRIGKAGEEAIPDLIKLLDDEDDDTGLGLAETAATALSLFGEAAVPRLLKVLKGNNAGRRERALEALRAMDPCPVEELSPLLDEDEPELRAAGITALLPVACDSPALLETILDRLEDDAPEPRKAGQEHLPLCGDAIVEPIMDRLDTAKKGYRSELLAILAASGKHAAPAVPRLVAPYGDVSQVPEEILAVVVAAGVGPDTVHFFIAALTADERGIRSQAVRALAGKTRSAVAAAPNAEDWSEAIPMLVRMLLVKESWGSEEATRLFEAMGPVGVDAVAPLVEALWTPDDRRRPVTEERIARALRGIGRDEALTVVTEALLQRCKAHEWPMSESEIDMMGFGDARTALNRMEEIGEAAVPAFVSLLGHRLTSVRQRGLAGLEAIGPEAASAARDVYALLDDAQVRRNARDALAAMGPAASDLLPELRPCLVNGACSTNSESIAEVILHIGPEDPEALAIVVSTLQNGTKFERRRAAELIGKILTRQR